jgi:hypothetical protein
MPLVYSKPGRDAVARAAAGSSLALLLLAACSTAKPPAPALPPTPPAPPAKPAPTVFAALPGLTPEERATRAMQLLDVGQLGPARAELDALLQQEPDNAIGKSLFRQIQSDPRALLGVDSFQHKVEAGETLQNLAEKYLGDRVLFWALARYNGVAIPQEIKPGQILQIPRPHRTERQRPEVKPGEARPGAPTAPEKPPEPPPPPHDPALAARLRGQALEALSRGQAGRAVVLLRQALAVDPDNALVKRDLERAQRIQSRVERH